MLCLCQTSVTFTSSCDANFKFLSMIIFGCVRFLDVLSVIVESDVFTEVIAESKVNTEGEPGVFLFADKVDS